MARKRLVVLLAALTAFGPMSLDLYLPGFPEIAAEYGVTTDAVQLTMSTALLGLGLGQVVWGPISDRYGRKRPLVVGLLVFVAASVLIVFAPSLPALVVLRLVQTLGGAAGVVVARAAVRDLYSGAELARMMSAIVTVFALAPVVAPLIGSALLAVGSWHWMFAFLAVFALACLVGVLRMPETLPEQRRTTHDLVGAIRQYGSILSVPQFRVAAVVAALGSTALFSYISSSPIVIMDSYGVSESMYALTFAGLSLAFAFGAQVNMRLLKQFRVSSLLRSSVLTQAVGSLVLLGVALMNVPLALFLIPLLAVLMTVAGVNSNGMALALDPFPRGAASAAALVGGMQMVMGAVASGVLAKLPFAPPVDMAVGMVAASSVSLMIVSAGRRHLADGVQVKPA